MTNTIQKLKEGRAVSKQDWAAAKQNFENLYAQADEDTKAKVTALMQTSQNWSVANPMNNRSAREFQTQMYNNASAIMSGNYQATPTPMISDSQANYVTNLYLNKNKKSETPTSTSTSAKGIYDFRWNPSGLLTMSSDSLEDRIRQLAEQFGTQLDQLSSALQSGKTIKGIDIDSTTLNNYRTQIQNALTNTDTKSALTSLLKVAGAFGMSQSDWDSHFEGLMPGSNKTKKDIAKEKAISEGYNFDTTSHSNSDVEKYRIKQNYILGKKDNDYYFFDQDYNLINNPYSYINQDYRDSNTWNSGFVTGNTGIIKTFDADELNQIFADQENPYFTQLNQYRNQLSTDNTNKWYKTDRTWDQVLMRSNIDFVNQLAPYIHGKIPVDISNLFNGDKSIVAVSKSGKDITADVNGNLHLTDPDLEFYYSDSNGQPKKANSLQELEQLTNEIYSVTGWNNETYNPLFKDNWHDYADFATGEILDMSKNYNGRSDWHNFWNINGSTEWSGRGRHNGANVNNKDQSRRGQDISTNIEDHPTDWAIDALTYIKNIYYSTPEEQKSIPRLDQQNAFLAEQGYVSNKRIFLNTIARILVEHPEILQNRPDLQNVLYSELDKTQRIQTQKIGGIISAATGTALPITETLSQPAPVRVDKQAIRDKVYNEKQEAILNQMRQRNINEDVATAQLNNKWTTSDTLRATALATDVAGLIAAITGAATGGIGSAVAVGTGFGSMGLDLAADITDDSVSAGQATKNALINTGLAVGAMFGAKAPKIIKSALKLIPKAMIAAGAVGIAFDSGVQDTINKMQTGKKLTVEDWKNISLVLRTATGIATVGTVSYGAKKAGKRVNSELNKNLKSELKGIKSELDPNIKYLIAEGETEPIAVKKEVANQVETALKAGKKEEALKALTESGIEEEIANKLIFEDKGKLSWKFWKGRKTNFNVQETSNQQMLQSNPEYASAAARAKLKTLNKIQSDFRKQQQNHQILNWMDQHSLIGKQQNYAENALLGSEFVNANQLKQSLNNILDKTRPIVSNFTEGNFDATAARLQLQPELNQIKENKRILSYEKLYGDVKQKREHLKGIQQELFNKKQEIINKLPKTTKNSSPEKEIDNLAKQIQIKYQVLQDKIDAFKPYANQFKKDNTPKSRASKTAQQAQHELNIAQKEYDALFVNKRYKSIRTDIETYVKRLSNFPGFKSLHSSGQTLAQNKISRAGIQRAKDQQSTLNANLLNRFNELRYASKKDLGISKVDRTVSSIQNQDITIPKGTKIESVTHLVQKGTGASVRAMLKNKYPQGIELSQTEATKLVSKDVANKVHGAIYDKSSNTLSFYQPGGSINYNKLRK